MFRKKSEMLLRGKKTMKEKRYRNFQLKRLRFQRKKLSWERKAVKKKITRMIIT